MACPLCLGATQSPSTYTVQVGDTLSGIVLKLGMCAKEPGGDVGGWLPCLAVAERIARANGIPWSGPPAWSAPISPGQVLKLNGGLLSSIPVWAKVLGLGAVLVGIAATVKAPAKKS